MHGRPRQVDWPDEPDASIGCECLELWQQRHGEMPEELQWFLTSCETAWYVRMAAYLLYVKAHHTDSPVWGPYIASLPPVDEDEAAQEYKRVAKLHLTVFSSEAGELRRLRLAPNDVADTAWAYAMARTRSFGDTFRGEALSVMAPFADLANHSLSDNCGFRIDEPGRLTLYAKRPIFPGEEVLVPYGPKSNVQMMNNYGFVLLGNPSDRVAVSPAPSSGMESLPPLHGASLLEALGLEGDWRQEDGIIGGRVFESGAGDAEDKLAVIRRRYGLMCDGYMQILAIYGVHRHPTPPPGAALPAPAHHVPLAAVPAERANAAAVRAAFRAALDALPTSLEADAELLAAHERSGSEGAGPSMQAGRQIRGIVPQPDRGPAAGSTRSRHPTPPPGAALPAPAHHVPLAAVPAERANAAAVRAAFRAALDALPTSLEADAELLAAHERSGSEGGEGRLSARVAAAVRSRMEHKALLAEGVRAMDMYDSWLGARLGAE
ncbi:hypothetical protein GPECTOR_8g359 [Gonium pectorale]|uniref:SET domain-containing protein n=1 Tax=Gonium pectorale TaxID=33097 RepID=A0A150GTI2_GONPE|nr:hypothetical protein GPECTOR_8g359 [Gonium pectorale]|eukprot:KXZ52988.1 hypothetical protein GPECTOR_8g359 [Gonium pectorale]